MLQSQKLWIGQIYNHGRLITYGFATHRDNAVPKLACIVEIFKMESPGFKHGQNGQISLGFNIVWCHWLKHLGNQCLKFFYLE